MNLHDFKERYNFKASAEFEIGEGGQSTVYRAFDTFEKKYVAIKKAVVRNHEFSLMREVELMMGYAEKHANLATYKACYRFDIDMVGLHDFAILKYYEHGNLAQFLKKNKLPDLEFKLIVRGMLEGLVFLHNNKIIHRDFKDTNVLIEKEDGIWVPKITDFGLSKEDASVEQSSILNSSIGFTPAFAAPEQILDQKIRKNVDLWSFGVVLYKMCTGKLPYDSSNNDVTQRKAEITKKILLAVLPNEVSTIEEPYQSIIKLCLVRDRKNRVQAAEELLGLLDEIELIEVEKEEVVAEWKPTIIIERDEGKSHSKAKKKKKDEDKGNIIEVHDSKASEKASKGSLYKRSKSAVFFFNFVVVLVVYAISLFIDFIIGYDPSRDRVEIPMFFASIIAFSISFPSLDYDYDDIGTGCLTYFITFLSFLLMLDYVFMDWLHNIINVYIKEEYMTIIIFSCVIPAWGILLAPVGNGLWKFWKEIRQPY